MVRATSQKLISICEQLEERYGVCKPPHLESFIEEMMYQILLLGASDRQARKALAALREEFVTWNDMRVGTVREIQDILGPKYPHARVRAEDLRHLLADFYTAFRRMELEEVVRTSEGIETLRALPETTLVREDMVEWALLHAVGIETFPCNQEQFELLKFLGGLPKTCEYDAGREAVLQALDKDQRLRLCHGLREHSDLLEKADEYDPQPIGWNWKKDAVTDA
jgi:endonuclease III